MINTELSYVTINNVPIWRPPAFAPKKEDIYRGDYTTCTGKLIADRIGWKFSDIELSWPALPQSMVDALNAMSGINTIEFDDIDGIPHVENVVRTSAVALRHRHTQGGEVIWKNVKVSIRFINAHAD